MNWKSGLFRVWLLAPTYWIAFAAWGAYVDFVVPSLQLSLCKEDQDRCFSARESRPERGNYFDCYDNPPPMQNLFDDLIPHYGWFGAFYRLLVDLFTILSLLKDGRSRGI
jgi:hypothetical protein